MWSRVDDALADHPKVFAAAEHLGPDGLVKVLGFYLLGLMWANKQLTDGWIPLEVVKNFRSSRPLVIANKLVAAGLWHRVEGGYQIHDFKDFNYSAAAIKERRERDRIRKRNGQHHG